MNEYVIRFSELNNDTETFEFLLGESFFKVFQTSEWEGGKINARVLAEKRPDGLTLDFNLSGKLDVVCDMCLDVYAFNVNVQEQLFLKYGQEEMEIDDKVVVVSKDDNQVDISQFLYEYLLLSLPVKKVHPYKGDGKTGCNEEMIEKLKKHMVQNESEQADSRWDDLKKLLDKN